MWRTPFILVGLLMLSWGNQSARPRLSRQYKHHDALVVARCEASCWTHPVRNQVNQHRLQISTCQHDHEVQRNPLDAVRNAWVQVDTCVQRCISSDDPKPGECPTGKDGLSVFDTACLRACARDQQCPGIAKCCQHRCGITCQSAKGLERVHGLPRIPIALSAAERRKGRALHIKWSPADPADGIVLYVLEERHHAGSIFTPSWMGAWTPLHRSNKTSIRLKGFVKPGRWYQFRVAAVNRFGSRGWSSPSKQFITSLGPRKPASPPNIHFGPLIRVNGTIHTRLNWDHPVSDFPINRYRIYWSKRLYGAEPLDSVLVQTRTVPSDSTSFKLIDLLPNSMYFIQIQAVSRFGSNKLEGEKAAVFLNTTNHNEKHVA